MRSIRRRLTALTFVLVTAGAVLPPMPARATPPGSPGRIAIGCEAGLWTIDADGQNLTRITDEEVATPDWSPGGTMIAFTRAQGPDHRAMWFMQFDDPSGSKLTNSLTTNLDPSWLGSAERIGYSTDQGYGPRAIRVIPANSNSSSGVWAGAGWDLHDPAFSPVDYRLLVVMVVDGEEDGLLLTAEDAGSFTEPVTPPPGSDDGSPEWAPAGDRFAFVRDDGTTRSINAVDPDGTDFVRLTDQTLDAISPTYAGDGSAIAFLARPADEYGTDAPFDLWTAAPDGTAAQMVASELPCDHIDWQSIPDFPLVDAKFSDFESAIRWAYFEGVAGGCAPERFCDREHITRGQMASFVARALDLPAATDDYFADDNGTTHEDDINRLVESGIASGCTPSRFCHGHRLTRAQMAAFVARALELPTSTTDHFSDDTGSTYEHSINKLAEAGLTAGCAPSRFCPDRPISRGETVALLYRALGD